MDEPLPAIERVKIIRRYAQASGHRCFVETGTGDGSTVGELAADFDRCYTIELNTHYYWAAWRRFVDMPAVQPIWGDSEDVLWMVLKMLPGPAVFWLDAHWDKGESTRGKRDTPVEAEMQEIMYGTQKDHVLLLDDARFFPDPPHPGDTAYPPVPWIRAFIQEVRGDRYTVRVRDDIIRIAPVNIETLVATEGG